MRRRQIQFAAVLVFAVLWVGCGSAVRPSNSGAVDDSAIGRAFSERTSKVQVEGEGVVTRILSDDVSGSRHQRFIVRLGSGQTLLVTHNIDIAPRIAGLREGDVVSFYGEYAWNPEGGVVHWTHHDPEGRHAAGWLRHNGQTYQ